MWGANSSGKTYGAVAEVCMHLTGEYPSWFRDENKYPEPVDCWLGLQEYDAFEDTHKTYVEEFVGPLVNDIP